MTISDENSIMCFFILYHIFWPWGWKWTTVGHFRLLYWRETQVWHSALCVGSSLQSIIGLELQHVLTKTLGSFNSSTVRKSSSFLTVRSLSLYGQKVVKVLKKKTISWNIIKGVKEQGTLPFLFISEINAWRQFILF